MLLYLRLSVFYLLALQYSTAQSDIHFEYNHYMTKFDGQYYGIGYDMTLNYHVASFGLNYVNLYNARSPLIGINPDLSFTTRGIGFKVAYNRFLNAVDNGIYIGLRSDFHFLRNKRVDSAQFPITAMSSGVVMIQPTVQIGYQYIISNKVPIEFYFSSGINREIDEINSTNKVVYIFGVKSGIVVKSNKEK